jgi:hypothetical protein
MKVQRVSIPLGLFAVFANPGNSVWQEISNGWSTGKFGAGGGIRTLTRRTSGDFESPASPSSATPAGLFHPSLYVLSP